MTSELHGADYLDDLESRQDEVLRLLADLETRIEQSLAELLAQRPPVVVKADAQHRAAA